MGYRQRLVDPTITRLLAAVGAISVEGPKWCGKTWTSLNHAESVFYVSDPTNNFANRTLARLDLSLTLEGAQPRAIDEWQEVPAIWDGVRFHVDQNPGAGQFLLTGSSRPTDDATVHSGTGRIARLRMRPMTLVESGDATATISLSGLLSGEPIRTAQGGFTLGRIVQLVIRGGWPGSIDASTENASEIAASYLDSLTHIDISQIDERRRDPEKVIAVLQSLARNTATMVGVSALGRDMASIAGSEPSASTIREYVTLLQRLYVLEQIPAWHPALRSPVRLRQAPKRMLADPSLAVAALRASKDDLQQDPKTLGFIFESLVLRDLLVYAQNLQANLWHYRDDADLEVDAILTMPTGKWAAIEIKLGYPQVDEAAANLLRLRKKLAASGDPPPAAMIVVVGIGAIAQIRDDGVCVVPLDLLGP